MKQKIIETIRAVPIAEYQSYAEYVEAVAEKIVFEVAFPPYVRTEAKALSAVVNVREAENEQR